MAIDKTPFQTVLRSGTSRRALLFMPLAFGGLALLSSRRSRLLPSAEASGTGATVRLVLFSDSGEKTGVAEVKRIQKSDADWRRELTAAQYAVARRKGTEPAFTGATWNEHRAGIYRCVCCGNALFRSGEKFDSGTGWPSFWAPVAEDNIRTSKDISFLMERTEVLCAKCDAHLGHVFNDGPQPTGLRYCMNSVAMAFIGRVS